MKWLKQRRIYRKAKREAVYPIHAWSLGMLGSLRGPLTWFSCSNCGHSMLGGPYEKPDRKCFECTIQGRESGEWVVADELDAFASTLKACDGRHDLVRRALA